MSEANHAAQPEIPLIRLVQEARNILVVQDHLLDLPPFRLPLVGKSMIDQLSLGMHDFMVRHRRCVAVLLTFDVLTRQWGYGIPRQRAGFDAASWHMPNDKPAEHPAGLRIAGSFQTRLLAPAEQPFDAAPPIDSLNLVQVVEDSTQTIWCFLRVGKSAMHVQAADVIYNDQAQLLLDFESCAEIV